MSDKFSRLVFGLPPMRRQPYDSANERRVRTRLVLAALAAHADEHGQCRAGNLTLCGWTGLTPYNIRAAINDAAQDGFIERTFADGHPAPVYTLVEDRLKACQYTQVVRDESSTYLLVDFGLPDTTAARLVASGWDSVESIGEELTLFEEQAEVVKARGLGTFLGIRSIGGVKAAQIQQAYRAYKENLTSSR